MKPYLPRLVDQQIKHKLRSSGAVVLRGARAVGKTTTALHHAASSVRLDQRKELIQVAELTPETLLAGPVPRLIDEWQLAPSIWNSIRAEIDFRGTTGQFILTGSTAPADDITKHSGTGRMARLTLRPMTLFEQGISTSQVDFPHLFNSNTKVGGTDGPTVPEYASLIATGGWPALYKLHVHDAMGALRDYIDNISATDLRTLDSPPDPIRMASLIRALARNIATEASLEKLSLEAELPTNTNIATATVRKYLDQLTQVFVLEELPAWQPHLRSSIRMRVKPKWFFTDPSLAVAALGTSPDSLLQDLQYLGLLFEALVLRDLRVYAELADATVAHYRDSTGLEVDAIVEQRGGKWIAVEVKLGGKQAIEEAVAGFSKLRLRLTEQRLERLAACVIITGGQASYTRPDKIHVVSMGHLFCSQAYGAS